MNEKDLNILVERLPAYPNILRKSEYFNSAVLIPLIKINREFHFLFEKRAEKIRQGGEVCFPGGEIEWHVDKNPEHTAIRETCEELGINKNRIKVLGELGTLIGPPGVIVESFLGVLDIDDIQTIKFDSGEVEKIFSIPVSYFMKNEPKKYFVHIEVHPTEIDKNGNKVETFPVKKLHLPERYSLPWKGRGLPVLVYPNTQEVIWGITAALIHEVILILKDKK